MVMSPDPRAEGGPVFPKVPETILQSRSTFARMDSAVATQGFMALLRLTPFARLI